MKRSFTFALLAGSLLWLGAPTAPAAFPGANGPVLFDDVVMQDTNDDGSPDVFTPVVGRIEASGSKSLLASGVSATTPEQAVAADPASDAMGERIAYVKGDEIWLMASDGSGQRLLVADGREPAWSPSGATVVFTSERAGGSDLYSVEVATGDVLRLTVGGASFANSQPAWSPLGDQIAFTRVSPYTRPFDSGEARQVWLMPAPGAPGAAFPLDPGDPASGARQLTGPHCFDDEVCTPAVPYHFGGLANHSAAWSPNGAEIAFASGATLFNLRKLLVSDPTSHDGLTAIDVNNTSPAWSPDGQRIVFARRGEALTVSSTGGAFQDPVFLSDGVGANVDWAPGATPPPANTPTGRVTVLLPLVTLTFENVTVAGTTSVTTGGSLPPLPSGLLLLGTVFDITTTAVFANPPGVEVCIDSTNPAARLLHWDGASWLDVTTRSTATQVCGQVGSLSPFVLVVPADSAPPQLSLPADFAVDATSPAGAVVSYTVSASDDVDPSPVIVCTGPLPGGTFAIGGTRVLCTATDAAGNTSLGSFLVTVRGAPTQIVALAQKTLAMLNQPPLEALLQAQLENAAATLVANNKLAACRALSLYIAAVRLQSGRALTTAQAAELVADARRIRAVIDC